MKQVLLSLLAALVAGLLITCQQTTPLTPQNPVIGQWTLQGFNEYHLPAWFVAKNNTKFTITPTDTVYENGIGGVNCVRSFTLASDNTLSEFSLLQNVTIGQVIGQTDKGTWTVADTVVNLNVANNFPHKLTYQYGSDQLVTDKFAQTSLVGLNGDPRDTVRISYTIQLYYRRGDP